MADPSGSADRPAKVHWVEPAKRLPLRWGSYRMRLTGGLVLLIGGGTAIAGSNDVTLLLLLAGTIAHVAGWAIIPSDGWRRLTAVLPGTLGCWMLLAGPSFMGVTLLPYFGWLLVRHRPAPTWLTALFPIASAVIIGRVFEGYQGMVIAYPIQLAVMALAALLARVLHGSLTASPSSQPISRRSGPSTR